MIQWLTTEHEKDWSCAMRSFNFQPEENYPNIIRCVKMQVQSAGRFIDDLLPNGFRKDQEKDCIWQIFECP